MVTRNIIVRLSERIDAAASRLAPPPPPKPRHPGKEAIERMAAMFDEGLTRFETPEQTAARRKRRAEARQQLRDDPEVQELRALYVGVGEDDEEAQRKAELEVGSCRFAWPNEDAAARRRRWADGMRRQ
jgi:alkanesulfonate monooxygenase SsuD/methylene tetrahydromethanopterin reductase-like flavin-dependent oxidoreductase (luciferase family)